jgi:hypothetical protein
LKIWNFFFFFFCCPKIKKISVFFFFFFFFFFLSLLFFRTQARPSAMTAKLNDPYLGPATPGPGTYTLPSTLDETVSFSIAGRPRAQRDIASSTPGAGAYSVRTGSVHERAPAFSISGRTERAVGGAGSGVGPGQYTPREIIGAPAATIKGRARPPDVAHSSPGPKYLVNAERFVTGGKKKNKKQTKKPKTTT